MQFKEGYIYHLFNQGNNRRKIFFHRENYLFFLKKIETYVLPYSDILAWCLMPNHFHLMILINKVELPMEDLSHTMTQSHRMTANPPKNSMNRKYRSINDSIAIMLRSYTRAINKQEDLSGSLFKAHSKAECLNCPNGISPSWFITNGITQINIPNPEVEYPKICLNYIHQNPVVAGLVKKTEDWEYSSAADYVLNRGDKLINKERTTEYI